MKKIWLKRSGNFNLALCALLILPLVFSCSGTSHKKSKVRHSSLSSKKSRKFSQRIKPSESMQAGIAKGNSNYVFKDSDQKESAGESWQARKDSERMVQSDGQYRGYFKIGNPYQVFGVSYFPQNYEDYEEIGTASWYGDDFHGKETANGEIYDMQSMTAAHPTLPLPSLVRVTNLRNNKSVIVRVNDRGPFAKNRVIDVSEKAADALQFKGQGTTEVKIQLLRNDTDELLEKLKIKN
jgi:rare lipoprotein A (peptidoglycan hydrolase)